VTKVLIGIQARSTSSRLPKKHHEFIGSKRLLSHVISACQSSRNYVNSRKDDPIANVCILTPHDDPIGEDFADEAQIYYGSEADVLGRYAGCATEMQATHIVRITGDCPLIPPFFISKIILLGLSAGYDYLSNVDARCRSSIDGTDAEFFSIRMLEWLDKHSEDREHVTTLARSDPPKWAKLGFIGQFFDLSDVKLSVDTAEDLEHVRKSYAGTIEKFRRARQYYNSHCIHRV